MRSLVTILNESNPSKLPAAGQSSRLGTLLGLTPHFVRLAVAANVMVLPETARASRVLHAYAVAGTATGELTPVVGPVAAAGQVGITDDGGLVFNAVDAVTLAEVQYIPHEGDIVEEVVDVVSDVGTPLANRRAVLLIEVEALTGTATGVFAVEARGTTPGAGEGAVDDDGAIEFAAADAVLTARIKYVATPGVGTANAAVGPELVVEDKLF